MKIQKINRQSIGISGFTSVLETIPVPPKELFYKGTLPAKRVPTVAVIGSRKPTPYGIEVTRRIAYDLAKQGVVIISGLAYGVDAVAHKAALEAEGTTIAVLAGGLHKLYPAPHAQLANDIVRSGGALISEREPGYEARRYDFLARNRLVSGLADAIVVTEATEKSGTLSTVAHALEQNKEVFAVPGPITSLVSVGPNRLLQQGAHVALSAEDILRVIAPDIHKSQARLPLGDTEIEVRIIGLIQSGVSDGDVLLQQCTVSPAEFSQALTMMELKGSIVPLGGNRWGLG